VYRRQVGITLELNKFGMIPESVHSAGLEYITAFDFNSVAFAI